MSFSKSHVAGTLIKGYIKTPRPLEEQAFMISALQLCHNLKLKKHIFFPKLENADPNSAEQVRVQWEDSLEKQSREVCKALLLPLVVQEKLMFFIRSIALQLLIWSGRWKEIFNISCDLSANLWVPTDWTEDRIDERKIAERLLQDNRISNIQRYKLACVYCLEEFVLPLWDQIPSEERDFHASDDLHGIQHSRIVQIRSDYIKYPELFASRDIFEALTQAALLDQQTTAVIFYWNKSSDRTKNSGVRRFYDQLMHGEIREAPPQVLPFRNNSRIRLPPLSAYGDIFCFFLSQLSEEKRSELFEANSMDINYMLCICLEWHIEICAV